MFFFPLFVTVLSQTGALHRLKGAAPYPRNNLVSLTLQKNQKWFVSNDNRNENPVIFFLFSTFCCPLSGFFYTQKEPVFNCVQTFGIMNHQ